MDERIPKIKGLFSENLLFPNPQTGDSGTGAGFWPRM